MNLIIKWNGKEYLLEDISEQITVLRLKEIIYEKTKVNPIHQKLLGINFKGKPFTDDTKLCLLSVKPGMKIMMMGTQEDILSTIISPPIEVTETNVIDDFDIEEEEVLIQNRAEYLAKVQKRVDSYKVYEINPPRPGKRLLVLDIDYTIFDHRSSAENGFQLMRPYLHEFLATVYPWYDIVIWSATGMKWIKAKMEELGMMNNDNYKLMFFMDSGAMITIHTEKYGLIETKPLGVIWGMYPQYSCKNTIMFDDLRRNFLMNPSSGLKIRPFQNAHQNRSTDCELLHLSNYLLQILDVDDFTTLRHSRWERYLEKHANLEKKDNK
ncbi:ubiquitin-like domain-containing CTD phosphatase 1 isoform X4 [Hydra vulgaris]|uniref:Ubiquitin-like domain-containing CTD phosphatase 1 n=1 Tax=Hydra vulgaris TaxID=6087 RepID=A0ABM4BH29_HYDVU